MHPMRGRAAGCVGRIHGYITSVPFDFEITCISSRSTPVRASTYTRKSPSALAALISYQRYSARFWGMMHSLDEIAVSFGLTLPSASASESVGWASVRTLWFFR